MYFPNPIEEVCYEEDHINSIEEILKKGFDKYFQKYIETENANSIDKEKFKQLASKFKIQDNNKKQLDNTKKILQRIINDEIDSYEKDRDKYLEFLNSEYLEEYEDDPSDFKNTVLRNSCPVIRHTLQNKKAKELDKYRYEFSIASGNNLLNVVTNIVSFAEEYKNNIFPKKDFYNIDTVDDLELNTLIDEEDYIAYGVIGAGIRSHFLYKLYPHIFPNRSRDAIWSLWYLTDKENFGCKEDSEFLMIKIKDNTTQQNFFYPYDLFTYYSIHILKYLKKEFLRVSLEIPDEYCFVIVDSFLSFVATQHRDAIRDLSHKETDYVPY